MSRTTIKILCVSFTFTAFSALFYDREVVTLNLGISTKIWSNIFTHICFLFFAGMDYTCSWQARIGLGFLGLSRTHLPSFSKICSGGQNVDPLFSQSSHTWNLFSTIRSSVGNTVRRQQAIWLKSHHKQRMARNSYQTTFSGPEIISYGAKLCNSCRSLNKLQFELWFNSIGLTV